MRRHRPITSFTPGEFWMWLYHMPRRSAVNCWIVYWEANLKP